MSLPLVCTHLIRLQSYDKKTKYTTLFYPHCLITRNNFCKSAFYAKNNFCKSAFCGKTHKNKLFDLLQKHQPIAMDICSK